MLLTISNPLITGRGAPLEALQRDLQVGLLVTFVIQDQHYYGIGVDSEFRSLVKVRGTCKSLTAAAGSHVRSLRCKSACDITKEAWNSFINTDGLYIEPSFHASEYERQGSNKIRLAQCWP